MSHKQQWFFKYNDTVHGPFSSKEMRQMARLGQVTSEMQIRLGETGKWKKASSVKGLFQTEETPQPRTGSQESHEVMPSSASDDSSSELSDVSNALSSDELDLKELFDNNNPLSNTQPSTSTSSESVSSGTVPVGEVRSIAPPLPGTMPIENQTPSASTPNSSYNSGSFGEMPSPPPPIPGGSSTESFSSGSVPPPPLTRSDSLNMSLSAQNNQKSESPERSSSAIPSLIQELLSPNEEIYYADHPTVNVLFIRLLFVGISYFIFGFIPSISNLVGGSLGFGFFYFILTAFLGLFAAGACYVQWLNLFYVVTSRRTLVKSGVFSVEVSYLYNDKIQVFSVKTGLIDIILHLNTIILYSSGGKVCLRWISLKEVLKFYSKLDN